MHFPSHVADSRRIRPLSLLIEWAAVTAVLAWFGPPLAGQDIAPTSFQRAAAGAPGQIRFSRRAARVGDQIEQIVNFDIELEMTSRQGQQIIDRQPTESRRRHHRLITAADVNGERTIAAQVKYLEARARMGPIHEETASEPLPNEPVAGKTYRCRRDGQQLVITDKDGNLPPLAEFQIVAQHMDGLGKINPLAEYLHGRTLTIGQRVALPKEVADELLGLNESFGEITRFELTLVDVTEVDDVRCALFQAAIDAASSGPSQMRMELEGTLVIQIDTCRAVSAKFSGPLGLAETRGSYSQKIQLAGGGRMSLAIRSKFRDIAR